LTGLVIMPYTSQRALSITFHRNF